MGCFNVACSVSNLSINYGDRVVFIPLLPKNWTLRNHPSYKNHVVGKHSSLIYSNCYFNPLTFPIKGQYNDYGGLENVDKDANTEAIEKFFKMNLLFIGHDKRGGRMKLQDLASVRSGLVLSRKQAKEPSEYRYPLINLRCIQQEGTIQLKEADIYEAKEPLKEEYLSQSGDIIVRLTAPYTAVLIDETTSGMVVSSNFVVIRAEDKSLLPEYLFWLLNTEKIKRKIYENATSNMLGAVKARFLADFELVLLSEEDQCKISQFNLLAKRERQLLRMLAEEKEKYYAGVLNQAYKRAKKGK